MIAKKQPKKSRITCVNRPPMNKGQIISEFKILALQSHQTRKQNLMITAPKVFTWDEKARIYVKRGNQQLIHNNNFNLNKIKRSNISNETETIKKNLPGKCYS
jgi:hypothetical protein